MITRFKPKKLLADVVLFLGPNNANFCLELSTLHATTKIKGNLYVKHSMKSLFKCENLDPKLNKQEFQEWN